MCRLLGGTVARDEFEKYDKVQKMRETLVSVLREKFAHFNLTFSIGGQISFDVLPQGWDKTYCLRYLEEFNEIHFFGDKTYKVLTCLKLSYHVRANIRVLLYMESLLVKAPIGVCHQSPFPGLRNLVRDAAVFGDTNLELPSFLSNRSLVEVHLEVGTNLTSQQKDELEIHMELPLHARYQ
uniref:Phosphomannomutase n=1 Tax=Solanum lycopersicum TaxID=4081 RepID=A0A3Q7HRS3_SOLLC